MVNHPPEDFKLSIHCKHKWSFKHYKQQFDYRDGIIIIHWNEAKGYHFFTLYSKARIFLLREKLTKNSLYTWPHSNNYCERTSYIHFIADYGNLKVELRKGKQTYYNLFSKFATLLNDIGNGEYERFRPMSISENRRKRRYSDDSPQIRRSSQERPLSQGSNNNNNSYGSSNSRSEDDRSPLKALPAPNRPSLENEESSPSNKKPRLSTDNCEVSCYKKISGLKNIGNTCYMNACIQALFSCPFFTKQLSLLKQEAHTNLECETLIWTLFRVYEEWQMGYVSERTLWELKKTICLKDNQFIGDLQHDVQELLMLVLDGLKEEVMALENTEPSRTLCKPTQDTFEFQISSIKTCQVCLNETKRAESNIMLSLHIPPEDSWSSLQDAIDGYFQPEMLEITCETCSKVTPCAAKDQFGTLPKFLILHLKRYRYEENSCKTQKVGDSIEIPLYITLKNCVSRDIQPLNIPSLHIESDTSTISNPFDEALNKIASGLKGGSYPSNEIEENKENEKPQAAAAPPLISNSLPALPSIYDDEEKALEEALQESINDAEEKELQNAIQNSIEGLRLNETKVIEKKPQTSSTTCERSKEQRDEINSNMMTGYLPHSYRLVGVVNHLGATVENGHYYCDVYDSRRGIWWNCNDDLVSSRTYEEMLTTTKHFGYLFIYASKEELN